MSAHFCLKPGCSKLLPEGRAYCPEHDAERRAGRQDDATAHKQWYDSARWQRLRAEVLRDAPFCVHCQAERIHRLATEVDHIRKHEGDPRLFWDRANLQGLCKPHHTRKTASERGR